MLLWYSSILFPRSYTSLLRLQPLLHPTRPASSLTQSSGSTVFRQPLYRIEMPSSQVVSGVPCSILSEPNWQCQQHFTPRLMAKRNARIVPWRTCWRAFVGYRQDDSDQYLTSCQFACNNAPNASTGNSPFRSNHGRDPRTPYTALRNLTDEIPAATDFMESLANASKIATDALALAKANQETNANRSRRPLTFAVGDQVLLSSAHITLASQAARPSRKLQPRFIGPYRILQQVSPVAYKLELPESLKVHPVFHVSLLRPYEDPQHSEPTKATNSTTPSHNK